MKAEVKPEWRVADILPMFVDTSSFKNTADGHLLVGCVAFALATRKLTLVLVDYFFNHFRQSRYSMIAYRQGIEGPLMFKSVVDRDGHLP